MARIFEDNFTTVATGTGIGGDTPDTAGVGTWTTIAGAASAIVDANDRVYNSGADGENVAYRCTDTPADADYYVECVLYKHSDINQDAVGPLVRWTTVFNWYHAGYDDINARVTLTSVVSGSGTLIGTPSSQTFSATENHTVRLVCNGSTISVDWDGAEVLSTTNTDHTTAGQAGLYIDHAAGTSATTGIHIQSIVAENDLPAGGSTPGLLMAAHQYYYG